MSVPEGRRSESAMQFLDTAMKIAETAMRLTKKMPKRLGNTFSERFINCTLEALDFVKMGNSIYPQNAEERDLRARYFKQARAKYESFISLVELGNRSFGIQADARHTLAQLVSYEIKLLNGVLKNDRRRFSSLDTK